MSTGRDVDGGVHAPARDGAALACIGQPVSWLVLEQLALAELDDADAARVRDHVEACAACRAALATIEADAVVLPALPSTALATHTHAHARSWHRRWSIAGGAVAALAAAAVLLLWLRAPGDERAPGRRARVKGAGVVVLTLVRERAGAVTFDPADVEERDRWKAQLTCDRAAPLWTDVVVYQRGQASFPLSPQPITCGNAVPVPGAFRITDGGATICVALGTRAPDRAELARGAGAGGAPLVCGTVTAAPSR